MQGRKARRRKRSAIVSKEGAADSPRCTPILRQLPQPHASATKGSIPAAHPPTSAKSSSMQLEVNKSVLGM